MCIKLLNINLFYILCCLFKYLEYGFNYYEILLNIYLLVKKLFFLDLCFFEREIGVNICRYLFINKK